MNRYPEINPFIVASVEKYAKSLYVKFHKRLDPEDLQQDLMFAVIQALEKFDPRLGFIENFVNRCLLMKSKEIARNFHRQKRKTFLNTYQLEAIQQYGTEQNIFTSAEINSLLDSLPEGLRKKVNHSNGLIFNTIKKILSAVVNLEGVKKVKNISCIETLSVKELSKLSETDLCDLSEKISETHNWIKQLVEKFEIALATKYSNEARKKLQESGTDFGTCELKKDAFTVTVQLPKKVQWDQEILKKLYDQITPENQKEIFKVTFSIDERKYAKLDQILREYLASARTTTYGKVKISINKNEECRQ